MSSSDKVAVLGGGSFGTVLANLAARNGVPATLWMRDRESARRCLETRENAAYLPGYRLADALAITADLEQALGEASLVFFSVPSKAFRRLVEQAAPRLREGAFAVSTAKGIEEGTFKRTSQILEEYLPEERIGALSGPNLAREIAAGEITATVIASSNPALCAAVQRALASPRFRVYANPDRFGVELAGALKNIFAIVAGIAAALGVGQNTLSVLITRSLAEMTRFAARLGADPMTFLGLAGVGDLIATCTSPLSRNFRVGLALGQGLSLEEATARVGQVAEGVNTTRLVKQKADELGVYMPLTSALYGTLFERRAVMDVLRDVLSSSKGDDVDFSVRYNHEL
ncbi:MAG: glycerol-3-phosphate dehydrogenase [NAD(P)+] [Porticoccaceae bacterium]|nr:MAG: glycerol-3-phosphate dehydrogenase [NAD(P)+] [Porticoccaceae bacterium]